MVFLFHSILYLFPIFLNSNEITIPILSLKQKFVELKLSYILFVKKKEVNFTRTPI